MLDCMIMVDSDSNFIYTVPLFEHFLGVSCIRTKGVLFRFTSRIEYSIFHASSGGMVSRQNKSDMMAHRHNATMLLGLYLNEGFATLMQYMCIDKIFPEYEVFNKFCSDTVIPALGLDTLQNSHPIEMPLKDARDIAQVFDYITYSKGASVLFMLHEFIGAKIFKEALQEYIEEFSYDNATSRELWRVLGEQSQMDVASIMNSWIRELGFPCVTVSVVPDPTDNPNNIAIELTQERFSSLSDSKSNMIWNIPVRGIYMTMNGKLSHFDVLFDSESVRIDLPDMNLEHQQCWIKLNPKMVGFYRVQYSKRLFDCLLHNLNSEHISAIDRISLLDDQFALVLSHGSTTIRILHMVKLFREIETNVAVWRKVIGVLHQIRTLTWSSEDTANAFEQFCIETLRPLLDKVGINPRSEDNDNDTMLRATVFSKLAVLRDPTILQAAAEMFRAHVEEVGVIPASLRAAVFRGVMVKATLSTLIQVKTLYRQTELAEDRVSILSAIGCSEDPNVLTQSLEFALSDEVEPQEAINTLVAAAASRQGYKLTWTFFVQNADRIVKQYIDSLFLFGRLIKVLNVLSNIHSMSSQNEINGYRHILTSTSSTDVTWSKLLRSLCFLTFDKKLCYNQGVEIKMYMY